MFDEYCVFRELKMSLATDVLAKYERIIMQRQYCPWLSVQEGNQAIPFYPKSYQYLISKYQEPSRSTK